MGSDDGRGQRGWVLAAWNDVGGRAGRVGLGQCGQAWVGVVSRGGRGRRTQCGWALGAGVGVGSMDGWSVWAGVGRHGQQGWAWAGMDGWVQAASAPDSVLIEYYKVTQKRLFLITLVY